MNQATAIAHSAARPTPQAAPPPSHGGMLPSSSPTARSVERFRGFFPWSSRVTLAPWPAAIPLAILAVLLQPRFPNASLAVICGWIGLLMFNADRPLIGNYVLSPVASLGFRQLTGVGLGLFIAALSPAFTTSGELRHILIHGICGGLAKLAGVLLLFRSGAGLFMPLQDAAYRRDVLRPLIVVGWLLLAYNCIAVIVNLATTGGADRAVGPIWRLDEAIGWWSWFNLFNNLKYSVWVIVPLIWMHAANSGRLILGLTCGMLVLPDFLGGSRTAIMIPALHLLAGIAMFSGRPINLDKYILAFMIPLVPFVAFWEFYRGSEAFRETRLVNWRERIAAVPKAFREYRERQEYGELEDEQKVAGWALYRYPDLIVYRRTPEDIPHAGWDEMATPLQIVVPTYFWPTKEQPVGGNEIYIRYTNSPYYHTGAGISLNCDLYRRFGDLGVPIGNFLVAILYGGVMSFVYRWYHHRNAVAGLATIIFFGAQGNVGLLDNACNNLMQQWLYIVPKHVVGILIVCGLARAMCRFPVTGAAAYRRLTSGPAAAGPPSGG